MFTQKTDEADRIFPPAAIPPVPAPRTKPIGAPRPSSSDAAPGGGTLRKVLTADEIAPTGPPDKTYKVVFAGDAAVGKTSFINRITKGVFLTNVSSTLGVDFQVKTFRKVPKKQHAWSSAAMDMRVIFPP